LKVITSFSNVGFAVCMTSMTAVRMSCAFLAKSALEPPS